LGILLLKITQIKVIFMENRTDLALECFESAEKTKLDGVIVRENNAVTTVEVTNENGALALGKPKGKYVTLNVQSFVTDTNVFDERLNEFSSVLKTVLPKNAASVLVVGVGNENITADSLGPKTNDYVLATRHILPDLQKSLAADDLFNVATLTTGVLGETGIETAEIVKGIVRQISPDCVIAVDALAASSAERLGTTIQFSDSGISPGSGVGNHRDEISSTTVGVPVIAIGIPTVVSTGVISGDGSDTAFVTPREIDRITEQGAKLIGMGINVCLQKSLSVSDLSALVG
jgi:spore protease